MNIFAMQFTSHHQFSEQEIADFFGQVFYDAEGAEEGKVIQNLAQKILRSTNSTDFYCDLGTTAKSIIAAAFYTRLTYMNQAQCYVLGPVAVATKYQRTGKGQQLLNQGIKQRYAAGVQSIVTYGDPNYYQKVGFQAVSESEIQAPFPLSMPHGWLLHYPKKDFQIELTGKPTCVAAFSDPRYW